MSEAFDSDAHSNIHLNEMSQPIKGDTTPTDCISKSRQCFLSCCGKTYGKFFWDYKVIWMSILTSLFYYIIGIIYYTVVEKWDFVKCIYFITVSLAGIGYGQLVPSSDESRVFTAFYDFFGLILIGFTLHAICRSAFTPSLNIFIDQMSPSDTVQRRYTKYVIGSICIIIVAFFIGLIYFTHSEPWTSSQAFYFVIITMTTIGYGDFVPTTKSSKGFLIFYIYFCAIAYVNAINNVIASYEAVRRANRATNRRNRTNSGTNFQDIDIKSPSTTPQQRIVFIPHRDEELAIDESDTHNISSNSLITTIPNTNTNDTNRILYTEQPQISTNTTTNIQLSQSEYIINHLLKKNLIKNKDLEALIATYHNKEDHTTYV